MLSINAFTRNYLASFLLLLVTYSMLWFEYIHTFNFWSYMGFRLDFLPYRAIISFLLFLISTHFICNMKDRFFKVIIMFLFVYTVIPSMIYFQYNPDINFSAVGGSLIFISCLYFISFIKLDIKPLVISGYFNNFYILLFLIFSLVPYLIYYPLPNLSFSSTFYADVIYQVRIQYREVEGPAFLGYYYGILTRVVLPFLLVFALTKKNYTLFTVCILIILYLFSLGALKSIIFGVLLTIIFYFGKDYDAKIRMILVGIIGLCSVSLLETFFLNSYVINDNLVRRVFFLPVLLHEVYSNYFDSNYQYWSHTLFGQALGSYNLNQSITFFVGETVMGLEGANANVGVMTEGYFSAGYLGVFVHSIFVGLIFIVIRAVGFNSAYIGVLLYFCYLLNTSFLLSLLSSHGLFALFIISLVRFQNRGG
tara:strand:+ start:701 stop:1966 length:1266 start_codon:yes stop_codon:yes gene_type:complete